MKTLRDLQVGDLAHGYDSNGTLVTARVNISGEFGKYYGNYDHDMSDSVEVSDIDYDYCNEEIVEIRNIEDAYEIANEKQEEIEIEADCFEFFGGDGEIHPARAKLIVETTKDSYIEYYDYYNGSEWVPTGKRSGWTEQEINDTFFPYFPEKR